MKKIIAVLTSVIALNANAEVINLISVSNPPQCQKMERCNIHSHHEIHIINTTGLPETYHYMYQLCLQGICDTAQNNITVYAGQRWDNSRDSRLQVVLSKGKYVYDVRTECGKEKSHNDYTIRI